MSMLIESVCSAPEVAKPRDVERALRGKPRVEIHAYVAPPEEVKYLREDEKRVMAERKRLKQILEDWDPMMISEKAKRDFKKQLDDNSKRLKDLRARMGK